MTPPNVDDFRAGMKKLADDGNFLAREIAATFGRVERRTVSDEREIETLAVFVHGALAFGHVLSLVYNLRRARRVDLDVIAHGLAAIYDVAAARKHSRRLTERTHP